MFLQHTGTAFSFQNMGPQNAKPKYCKGGGEPGNAQFRSPCSLVFFWNIIVLYYPSLSLLAQCDLIQTTTSI